MQNETWAFFKIIVNGYIFKKRGENKKWSFKLKTGKKVENAMTKEKKKNKTTLHKTQDRNTKR